MGRFVKWFIIFTSFIGAMFLSFTLYANFLLDYSLDNLESTLSATDKSLALKSPLVKNLYKNLVYDIALEETASEDADIKDVVLIGLASRSMDENIERAGYERASIYLNQVSEAKQLSRHKVLAFTDKLYYFGQHIYESITSVLKYLHVRLFSRDKKAKKLDYANLLLLSEAEEAQSAGNYRKAMTLYKKYLATYPNRDEYGFVSLSLAHLLIREKNFSEARNILKDIQFRFMGRQEQKLASSLLQRIKSMEKKGKTIQSLRTKFAAGHLKDAAETLRLGLAYFSSYEFDSAEEVLETLVDAKEDNIRRKAKFYLSRIYKEQSRHDKAIALLSDILSKEGLGADLDMGLYAELADHYYLNRQPEEAVKTYEILGGKAKKDFQRIDAAKKATQSLSETVALSGGGIGANSDTWAAVAEIEQANIYLFDFGDSAKAEDRISRLQRITSNFTYAQDLHRGIKESARISLRDQGFEALRRGEIHAAYSMFKRNIELFPRDAYTYSGLATTYVLLANLEEAKIHAQKGKRFKVDEYTASILAYVEGYEGNFESAITHYQQALSANDKYEPAHFNLGCMYLETGEYAKAFKTFESLEKTLGLGQNFMYSKVLNNMGFSVWRLGNTEQAKQLFERALKKTPGFVLAAKNLRKLALGEAPERVHFKNE